ncbi:MAG: uracil-DNA glycosylase family protein [Chloroflexota bacterium]
MLKLKSLTELHTELRACRLCLEADHRITPGPVFSSGPEPWVMLIGQAPGITEGQVKRPFNAGSGRRLFQWLGEAGWDEAEFRARHYMTAVTKCYPGPSGNGKGDRVASRAEQALCRPWLEQEMRLVDPRLVILVGGLAIKLVYPASFRLDEIIGTALFFTPPSPANLLNPDLSQAVMLTPETGTGIDELASDLAPVRGRFIVPLPHPSGASLWPNAPANRELIQKAIHLLSRIRIANDL